jgi:hypothetical protein
VLYHQVPVSLKIYTTYIPDVDKLENSTTITKRPTLQMQEQGSQLLHILILQIKRF